MTAIVLSSPIDILIIAQKGCLCNGKKPLKHVKYPFFNVIYGNYQSLTFDKGKRPPQGNTLRRQKNADFILP